MLTLAKKGQAVPITVLSDWWLLLCIPLLVLNVMMYVLRRTVLAAYFALLRYLAAPVISLLSRHELVNIPSIIIANAVLSGLLLFSNLPASHPLALLIALMLIVSSIMCIQLAKMAIEFRDGNRTDLVLRFTTHHNTSWDASQISLPSGIRLDVLSQGTWLGSLMVALFVLGQFATLLLAETGSLSFGLSVHALLLVSLLIDFEMVEHLAAHSRNGVLVRLEKPRPIAVLLYALEQLRIYFVWPLYYWAPKRYFLTHTHHHHIENNGPADWQSTLRFDLTSIVDFAKSLLWLQSSLLLPIDTARYFKALGRARHLKKLLISSAHNLAVIGIVFWLEPLFGLMLFCLYLAMSWVFHSFIFAWHGFHDSSKPYDVVASNNSTGHYAHHKSPGTHLFSGDLRSIYQQDSGNTSEHFPVYLSSTAFDVISRNWLLVQCLLWQKKYHTIRKLIKTDHLSDAQLQRLVSGVPLYHRHPIISRLDMAVSKWVGAVLEQALRLLATRKHVQFLNQP